MEANLAIEQDRKCAAEDLKNQIQTVALDQEIQLKILNSREDEVNFMFRITSKTTTSLSGTIVAELFPFSN